MNPIPKFAQSSIDPTQVSLTLISLGKTLVGVITSIAIMRGVDPLLVSTNVTNVTEAVQNIVAQYAAVVPIAYSAYHSSQFLWGIVRKIFVAVFAKTPVTPSSAADSVTIVPPVQQQPAA